MYPSYICVDKKIGQTPLDCIKMLKKDHPEWKEVPMTYAGRLDPMASGLMIILLGEECKNKDKWLGFDKTYEFEILVGFETDTYDLLGIVSHNERSFVFENQALLDIVNSFFGIQKQSYPSFSSKTVEGESLFLLAKKANLPKELPSHEVEIYSFEILSTRTIKNDELKKVINERVSLVEGDFRQKDILENWNLALSLSNKKEFKIISCRVSCSSGTYIRQLVSDIGVKMKIPLVTFSIHRTMVGDIKLENTSSVIQ